MHVCIGSCSIIMVCYQALLVFQVEDFFLLSCGQCAENHGLLKNKMSLQCNGPNCTQLHESTFSIKGFI